MQLKSTNTYISVCIYSFLRLLETPSRGQDVPIEWLKASAIRYMDIEKSTSQLTKSESHTNLQLLIDNILLKHHTMPHSISGLVPWR